MTDSLIDRLSPPRRLALLLARSYLDGSMNIVDRCRELANDVALNWNAFWTFCTWHKLTGVVSHMLTQIDAPLEQRGIAHKHLHALAINGLAMTSELKRIDDAFRTADLPYFQVKGLPFASLAYREGAHRISKDLDLFVRPQDATKAHRILTALRFQALYILPESQRHFQTRVYYQEEYQGPQTMVDLHWNFAPYSVMFPLSVDSCLADAIHTDVKGLQIPTPPLEDHLVFLCFHGAKHLWARLFWAFDLAAMTDKFHNWRALAQRAQDLRQSRAVAQAWILAERCFGIACPQAIRDLADQDPKIESQITQILSFLFDDEGDKYQRELGLRQKFAWDLSLLPRRRDQWSVCLRYLCQPSRTDLTEIPIPNSLFPLYYLLRPVRLAWRELTKKTPA